MDERFRNQVSEVGRRRFLKAIGAGMVTLASGLCVPSSAVARAEGSPVTLVAVGDMVPDPDDRSSNSGAAVEVAELITRINPDALLVLGDTQYPAATYGRLMRGYDPIFGRFLKKTHVVPGNHDHGEKSIEPGFSKYFGIGPDSQKGKLYHSFDLGGWHLVGLDSGYYAVGKGYDREQVEWLEEDLWFNQGKPVIAFLHHPVIFSEYSGYERPPEEVIKLTSRFVEILHGRAALLLSGHIHAAEFFLPDPFGMRQLILGTGGKSHYPASRLHPLSEFQDSENFGVGVITLTGGSYNAKFISSGPKIGVLYEVNGFAPGYEAAA